ncbi:hypothetical protein COV06_03480 [Candidatus Uhrbacteria bacterium CG10_big_fil_rev_8_21_14_0_10_50_16]|uniref:ATP-cone domain-containing protein n=1 Tax=Candidatus Uhrbacteria bacterium CG10_big_fil_rev_8_21_14_0_10_50_16 TaxID=1975039 RepID=A0A2H0RM24_9BACT|nr:MAG: hypothetical protein COV06_03480 [Candidatus Uhrbacteria bacterium CG10_big_fil_rev_8_21_14_0_10_50_16]
MHIRKSDGTMQPFDRRKLERALTRALVSPAAKQEVLTTIPRMVRPGTSTQQIHTRVLHLLESIDPVGAARFNLKHAMFQLGPSGFPFEQYIARILSAYGWQTETGKFVQGKCVQHEIDVYAKREGEIRAIEAKYRNTAGGRVDIKVALYVHARHLDLSARDPSVVGALFTNTELTETARIYSECVGMKVMAWNYPVDDGLAKFIEQKHLYPLTVFSRIPMHVVSKLTRDGIVLANQLCELEASQFSKYGLRKEDTQNLQNDSRDLCALHL